MAEVPLTRQRDVEIARLQLKQAGQQLCVIDNRAVSRIEIIPWAGMHPDAPALFRREPRARELVLKSMKAAEEVPRGIDLHGQPFFGEVHLNPYVRPFSGGAVSRFHAHSADRR